MLLIGLNKIVAINTYSILLYIQKIKPTITSSKEHAKMQLVYRFLKRNGFVLKSMSYWSTITNKL